MATIPPSSPVPPAAAATAATGPSAPAAPAGAATAVLTQLPGNLQSTAGPGTVINGTVAGFDNQGQALLQTNAGVITLRTSTPLTVGQQVSLQIQAVGSQIQAVILSTKGPTSGLATAGLPTPPLAGEALATPAATIAPSVTAGSIIVATVIGPSLSGAAGTQADAATGPPSAAPPSGTGANPGAAPTPGQPALPSAASAAGAPQLSGASPPPSPIATPAPAPDHPAQAGTPPATSAAQAPPPSDVGATRPGPAAGAALGASTATASASSAPVPQSSALLAAQESAPARPISAAVASYAAAAASSATGSASFPPPDAGGGIPAATIGTQIPLRLVGVLPTLTTATASAASGALVATVVGTTPTGQTIVDTAVGHLVLTLPPSTEIAVGGQLAFDIVALAGRPAAPAMAGLTLSPGSGLSALGPEWPALKAAIETLTAVDPPLARQILESTLPRPDSARFLEQILSFISAPARDIRSLLGQSAVDALQDAGHEDLISQLNTDLGHVGRLNASATDWLIFFIPLFDTSALRQLRVYTRRRKSGHDRQRESDGRFVVEVEFDEIGPLQLDGLVHKPRLDLILRSHADLPAAMRSGITEVFAQTCEAAKLRGEIFFQVAPSFPVSPLDEIMTMSGPGLSV